MKRTLEYNISNEGAPISIHQFLKNHHYSQSLIAQLKRTTKGIMRNDSWAYTRDLLLPGDKLTIQITEESTSEQILPVNLQLDIVYEDDDLMVINKEANVPIHPSQGNHENTLANAVAWYYKNKNEPFVYRCINRLDRDTSGLLILAKHAYSGALLSKMVGNKEIKRTYLAIATGDVESCTITAPIARKMDSTIERVVDICRGTFACTHCQKIEYKNGYSLVSLQLDTGRTHQIRVHMKHIGHPLPGDFLYNPDYSIIKRQALHSHRLEFTHPITKKELQFEVPLPNDMNLFF